MNNKGFTLIELLIAVIIVGIMAAIFTPSIMSWIGKARETDGQQGIYNFLKKQEQYRLVNKGFVKTENWAAKLGLKGIRKSANYEFAVLDVPRPQGYLDVVAGIATPKREELKSVIGVAVIEVDSETGEIETVSIVCRAKLPSTTPLTASDIAFGDGLKCVGNAEAIR